ncbi:hypothetical protein C2S53_007299 [Perilla frutescens var. hirtella]|uniref:Uncharacterized protein n=1 Tax=Perilla frutescens var. hirtella TaxID=608512 RepID=A0AAD4PDI6_PERFH|nr:hypothetical protein C2S53_007299 [Perilla frutescens var. hirtella]
MASWWKSPQCRLHLRRSSSELGSSSSYPSTRFCYSSRKISSKICDLPVLFPFGDFLLVGMASVVCLLAARGGVRAALDGGGVGGGGVSHHGDVDNGAVTAHVLRQAEEDAGSRGEEIDG